MLTRFLKRLTGANTAEEDARARLAALRRHHEELERIRSRQTPIFQRIMEEPWPEDSDNLIQIEIPAEDYDTLIDSMTEYGIASGYYTPKPGEGVLFLGAPVVRGERYALTFA